MSTPLRKESETPALRIKATRSSFFPTKYFQQWECTPKSIVSNDIIQSQPHWRHNEENIRGLRTLGTCRYGVNGGPAHRWHVLPHAQR